MLEDMYGFERKIQDVDIAVDGDAVDHELALVPKWLRRDMLTRLCNRHCLPIIDSYTCCAQTLPTPLDSHRPSDISILSESSAQVMLTSIPLLLSSIAATQSLPAASTWLTPTTMENRFLPARTPVGLANCSSHIHDIVIVVLKDSRLRFASATATEHFPSRAHCW